MKENILSRLLTECPFSEVFEDMETVKGCSFPVPRRKIGHIRADYDGWRWYNTVAYYIPQWLSGRQNSAADGVWQPPWRIPVDRNA